MKKMKVFDFVKQINIDSDDIPVIIRCGLKCIATDKSLYHYASHCGLEAERKISGVTIGKDQITIYVN